MKDITEKYAKVLEELLGKPIDITHSAHNLDPIVKNLISTNGLTVRITSKNDAYQIARFSLTQLPGCCGVLVSHNSHVMPTYRGKTIGSLMHEMRIEIGRRYNYTIMLCTDLQNNIPSRKILDKFKWQDAVQFKNRKTSNIVNLSYLQL